MKKRIIPFLLACSIVSGLGAVFGRPAAASGAQTQRSEEQWQPAQSRALEDSIWKPRKSSKQPPKRGTYRRVSVANSSTIPIKYERPSANGASGPRRGAGSRRAPRVKMSPVWEDVALASSGQVGVTIWRLRPCDDGGDGRRCFLTLNDGKSRAVTYEAVRVTTEADFKVGDGIQLAVESPAKGYIYVIHQEVYKKNQVGAPKLLFPSCEDSNSVGPGRPLMIPRQAANEGVKVLKMRSAEGKNLVAERLKIIVARKPMKDVCAKENPYYLAAEDVRRWESQWSGRLELFDLEGGDKEAMTRNEWSAMKGDGEGSRDLTTEDLAPQKLYLVERKQKDGVLITLDLPYGNGRVRPKSKATLPKTNRQLKRQRVETARAARYYMDATSRSGLTSRVK